MNININSISAINIAMMALNTTQEEFTKYVRDIASGSLSSIDFSDKYISDSLNVESVSKQTLIENAQQGMNLTAVASGALTNINESFTRIMELSARASSDVYSDDQRAIMQAEINELVSGINQTIENTKYNDKSLLNIVNDENPDMLEDITFEVSSGKLDESQISYDPNLELDSFSFDVSTAEKAQTSMANAENAIKVVIDKQTEISAQRAGLMSSIESNLVSFMNNQASYSQIADTDYASAMIGMLQSQIKQESLLSVLKAGFETQGSVINLITGSLGK